MDQPSEECSRFSGYDRPRSTRGRDTGGTNGEDRGRIPPTVGNGAGGGDPGDSAPLPIVTTPTPFPLIRAISWVLVENRKMMQGRQRMING